MDVREFKTMFRAMAHEAVPDVVPPDVRIIATRRKNVLASTVHYGILGGVRFDRFEYSPYWVRRMNVETARRVILHEIGHVIAGPFAYHGREWVDACKSVGLENPTKSEDL